MDTKMMRGRSKEIVAKLGYSFNPSLPLMDATAQLERTSREIVERTMVLHSICACSHGFKTEKARKWLAAQNISDAISPAEQDILSEDEVESYLGEQVETLWALMWVLGKIKLLDFGTLCSDDLVKMLPDLLIQESTDRFCSQIQLRSSEEIVSMTDTAYCLHWSLRDAEVNRRKRPGSVAPHVVIERRRALEWLLTSTPWDEITLDT